MKTTTNRILVCLPDNYVNDLDIYSQRLGLKKSDLIRRALDIYFKELKKEA